MNFLVSRKSVTWKEERANHGLPIEEPAEGGTALACESFGSPFLIDCDYDAAKLLLDHLYQPNFIAAPAVPSQNNLLRFDQTEFSGANKQGLACIPRDTSMCQRAVRLKHE